MIYTSFYTKGNTLYIKGRKDNGATFYEEKKLEASVYTLARNKEDTLHKSIYGDPLSELKFDSVYDAISMANSYKESGLTPYGFPNYGYTRISQEYSDILDKYDFSLIRIMYLDIEVDVASINEDGVLTSLGFPNPVEAKMPINAISIIINGNTAICFGVSERNYEYKFEGYVTKFIKCNDEKDLLEKFCSLYQRYTPDILTGWNIETFDIPFLVHRVSLYKDAAAVFSPYKKIKQQTVTNKYGEALVYKFQGVAIMDYLEMFKKHAFIKLENDKLNTVGKALLHEEKVDYEGQFYRFYHDDPETFFKYNLKDTILVHRLNDKLGLLELIVYISYFAKINYEDTFSPVKIWDSIISNRLMADNIHVPYFLPSVEKEKYPGGYVKEPTTDVIYGWLASVDMDSLYPTILRTWNIGPDTRIPYEHQSEDLASLRTKIANTDIHDLVDNCTTHIDTDLLKLYNYTMAANGEIYSREFEGIMSILVGELYSGRKSDKNKAGEYKGIVKELKYKGGDKEEIEKYTKLASLFGTSQLAKKVLLNSLYGALANEYFRFFRTKDASAITISGQFCILYLSNKISEYISTLTGEDKDSIVIYNDTDSVTGDTIISANGVEVNISSFFDSISSEDSFITDNNTLVKRLKENTVFTKSVNAFLEVESKPITYAMKHRVSKEMYEVTVGDHVVNITGDHSLIVLRDNALKSVSVKEIEPLDEILRLVA